MIELTEEQQSHLNRKLSLLKSSAKARGIKVKINIAHYHFLLSQGCTYCGDEVWTKGGHSLDRVDSKRGYVNTNIVACCAICNRAKSNLDSLEFASWVERAYKKITKDREEMKYVELCYKELLGPNVNMGEIIHAAEYDLLNSFKGSPLNYTVRANNHLK